MYVRQNYPPGDVLLLLLLLLLLIISKIILAETVVLAKVIATVLVGAIGKLLKKLKKQEVMKIVENG